MAQRNPLLLRLPLCIQLQIFEYLLVPGCFEIGKNGQTCHAILTYPIWRNGGIDPDGPERWRLLNPFFWNWYSKFIIHWRIHRESKYFKYQSRRNGVQATGPHRPKVHDLYKRGLHPNAIRIAKEQGLCGCGHCEARSSYALANKMPPGRAKGEQLVKPDTFWAPLLVCRKLYYTHRHLVFSQNVFSFTSSRDLARFLVKLQPWQRDLIRKVEVLQAQLVVLFEPGYEPLEEQLPEDCGSRNQNTQSS